MKMVLRSMYLDPELDSALGNLAALEGLTKAELMRRFLQDGLARGSTAMQTWLAKGQPVQEPSPEPLPTPSRWVAKDRFWDVAVKANELATTTGKIGTPGKRTIRAFESSATARTELAKVISSLRDKGFVADKANPTNAGKQPGASKAVGSDRKRSKGTEPPARRADRSATKPAQRSHRR